MPETDQPRFTRRSLSVAAVILAVYGGLLLLEARPGWCKYGFGVWSAAWSHCTSQNLFDPYSLTHILHGVLFYWMLRPLAGRVPLSWRLIIAMGIEVTWELAENSPWVIERYRQQTASLDYTGDSIINSLGDLLAAIAGFYFASRVSWKWAVLVFIVFELGMLVVVRDNLTLNVLMLFTPLEAVKQWQLQGL